MIFSFFQEMIMLYSMMMIGFIARRKNILNKHSAGVLTQLLLTIALPSIILYSLGQPYPLTMTSNLYWLIGLSLFILLLSSIVASIMNKFILLTEGKENVFKGLIIFGNQGFIGLAFISILFPEHGILYATLYNLPYLFFIWTYGIYLFVGSKSSVKWSKVFLNPGIAATLIGVFIFILPFHWPLVISKTLQSIGYTTIPLSMLLIGVLIGEVNLKKAGIYIKNNNLWIISGIRLLVIPLLLFPFIFLSLPFEILAAAVLISGMPAAPTIALYAQKYGGDKEFAAMGTLWTTIFSILTIPFLYLSLYFIYTVITF